MFSLLVIHRTRHHHELLLPILICSGFTARSVSEDSLRRYVTYASERCIQELLSASESSRAGGGDGWKVLAFQNGVEISKRSAGSLHVFRSRWLLRSVTPQQFIVVATAIDAAKVSSNTPLCSVICKHREASSDLSFRSSSRIQRKWQAIPCSSMGDFLALRGRWEARSDKWLDLPMGVHMTSWNLSQSCRKNLHCWLCFETISNTTLRRVGLTRTQWDPDLVEAKHIKDLNDNLSIIGLRFGDSSKPLFKKREFIVYERRETLDDGTLVVAVASLPKEIAAGLQPKNNKAIRGLLLQSGWVVEKLEDDSCMLDPAGWLPKCFVNRLNTKLVMIIENLKKLAETCPMEKEM
ncbi:START domain [Musa troglodytarum]|uniref:START domain n=1 Tax=Musa troglodytarum TaxID=320322 RepID=A0A9E7I929_9LILI|nr:START domain [Musa troglodytarum]